MPSGARSRDASFAGLRSDPGPAKEAGAVHERTARGWSADRGLAGRQEPAVLLGVQDEDLVRRVEHDAVEGVEALVVELAELQRLNHRGEVLGEGPPGEAFRG